ncbi:MAG: GNAT family N-acetyltransferase [Tepidisphaera sp.]
MVAVVALDQYQSVSSLKDGVGGKLLAFAHAGKKLPLGPNPGVRFLPWHGRRIHCRMGPDLNDIWNRARDIRSESGFEKLPLFHKAMCGECKAILSDGGRAHYMPFDESQRISLVTQPVMFDNGAATELLGVWVARELRRQGVGTRFLKTVARIADETGERLFVRPFFANDRTVEDAAIQEWVERLGFVHFGYGSELAERKFFRPPLLAKGTEADEREQEKVQKYGPVEVSDWSRPMVFYRSDTTPRTVAQIEQELRIAKADAVQPIPECSMPYRWCYQNVERVVRERGGELVLGWQVTKNGIQGRGVEMESHSIWRNPQGQLVEVTKGRPGWLFAPSPNVVKNERTAMLTVQEDTVLALKVSYAKQHVVAFKNPLVLEPGKQRFKKRK